MAGGATSIATVNDTEQNYEWNKTYLPNIEKTLNALQKSYGQLVFNSLSLRYIDVVRVAEYGKESWEAFVQEHINFSFHNQFDTRGRLARFHFEQAFKINSLGFLNVSFSSGQNNKMEKMSWPYLRKMKWRWKVILQVISVIC